MNTHSIFNGNIDANNTNTFISMLNAFDQGDKLTLTLATLGGDIESAFSLATRLRQRFSTLRVIVPVTCEGVGVLLTLIADELVFGDRAEVAALPNTDDDRFLTQQMMDEFKVELKPVAPYMCAEAFQKVMLTSPEFGLTQTDAEQLYSNVSGLAGSDLEKVSFYNDRVVPYTGDTYIAIENDAGQNDEYNDCHAYPILRYSDVARQHGLNSN